MKERAQRATEEAEQQLEWEYDDYREAEIDRYIQANPAAFEFLKNAKWAEDREKYTFATESTARIAARLEIRKQLTFPRELLTFRGTDHLYPQATWS